MYASNGTTTMWTDTNRNHVLRQYAKWEFGADDTAWLISAATRKRRRTKKGGFRRKLRYFLNSFRGFATFDIRGADRRDPS